MNYQEFQSNIRHALMLKLGDTVTVSLQEITKNNNTRLSGITIAEKGINISPTIYLNSYYEQYLAGKSLEDVYADILNVYQENRPTHNIDVSFFTDYASVKNKIIFKLINCSQNQELLESVPHYHYLDLAIVFCCLVDATEHGTATILIRNQHLSYWGISSNELYALACENTPRLLPSELRSMTSVLKELLCQIDTATLEDEELSSNYPMYVLTNSHKLHGSTCILYQNLLHDFADKLQADLYVLPSSIHEVLLIPAVDNTSCGDLSAMVREVNSTQLSADEILSDHVYFYSRAEKKLKM